MIINVKRYYNIWKKKGISYDTAVTLEEAIEKVLSELFDGIILDKYFSLKEGEEKREAGKRFLEVLEERGKQIPIVVYSTMGTIEHELVIEHTSPGDPNQLGKVEELLNHTITRDTKERE